MLRTFFHNEFLFYDFFRGSEAHHVANGAELRHVIGPGVLLQICSVPEPFAAEVTQVRLLPVGQQRLDAMR